MGTNQLSSIPVSRETAEFARQQKRGGETWDSLIRKMAETYDPDAENTN